MSQSIPNRRIIEQITLGTWWCTGKQFFYEAAAIPSTRTHTPKFSLEYEQMWFLWRVGFPNPPPQSFIGIVK